MRRKAQVVFTPSGIRGKIDPDTTVLDAARSLGVDLDSVCGGRGLCGRCQVAPTFGDFAKHKISSGIENLSPPNDVEFRFRAGVGGRTMDEAHRLGCQTSIIGDLVIDVPARSQVHQQVVRKNADHRSIPLNTGIHLYYVDVAEADMDLPSGDAQRLSTALADEWGLQDVTLDPAVLPTLQSALRQGEWRVTVAVCDGSKIIAVWGGFTRHAYGVAIDIGSTTIAATLCNLTNGEVVASSGVMNPQIRFGEDLMSRVSYAQMHEDGAAELTAAVRHGINELLEQVTGEAGIERDRIVMASIAGNPIMHHFFLGISPVELGSAPFALATDEAQHLVAENLEMAINPCAAVYVLPCIAGHVGADTAAVILAEEPHRQDAVSLVVDIGTNAEIVLGNRSGLLACSSPTGPAFEGAQISSGQRAAAGAIERVRIDRETFDVRFRVVGSELWSDDPMFAGEIEKTGITGICGSGIIEAVAEMFLAGIVSTDGTINGDASARSDRVVADGRTWSFVLFDGPRPIIVTQNDVRQVQLAKAALYAGTKLLMDHAGIENVDNIRLAGAFGSHIDPKYAMVLGLIPDCDLTNVSSAGNAAGAGARIALLNTDARHEIETVIKQVEKIETAVEPKFQQHFVDAIAIPHKTEKFPKLSSKVNLPESQRASRSHVSRGSRRRRTP